MAGSTSRVLARQADGKRNIESFNDCARDEWLSQHMFMTLEEAKQVIDDWRLDYNRERPRSVLVAWVPVCREGSFNRQQSGHSLDSTMGHLTGGSLGLSHRRPTIE